MNILLTGGTGFIGNEIGKRLISEGHKLKVVTRSRSSAIKKLPAKAEIIECDLNVTPLPAQEFSGIDVVVNLAGESIDSRWTKQQKNKIRNSRVIVTRNLLLNCPDSVKTLISASAIGYYGDRGNEELIETSPRGKGFLADVCDEWESEAHSFKGKRLVILRFGMVMSPEGGALKKLINIFSSHVGSPLGTGEQWVSFISLNDLTDLILHSIADENISGVYNAVNNSPVTNLELSQELAKKLDVMLLPRVPAFAVKLALGEMSELVLASQKVKSSFPMNFKNKDVASVF